MLHVVMRHLVTTIQGDITAIEVTIKDTIGITEAIAIITTATVTTGIARLRIITIRTVTLWKMPHPLQL